MCWFITAAPRQSSLIAAADLKQIPGFYEADGLIRPERTRREEEEETARPTSAEMRRLPRFRRQTPVGDCTSSEDVPDAWSLSPSEPIFRFSCTISKMRKRGKNKEWEWVRLSRSDDLSRRGKTLCGTLLRGPSVLIRPWLRDIKQLY